MHVAAARSGQRQWGCALWRRAVFLQRQHAAVHPVLFSYMSHTLDSLEGLYVARGLYGAGAVTGLIKGDTKSKDYSSHFWILPTSVLLYWYGLL